MVPGFQNYTGTTQADLLRLNLAIKPTTSKPSNLGLLGADAAGFPNGRRVFDDVTTIELRALAGATLPLVDKSYKADAAAGQITPGLTSSNTDVSADNTVHYLSSFPYLGTPHSGFDVPANNDPAPDLGAINQPPGQVPVVPVGPPQTGVGHADSTTGWLVGGGLALAGAAAIGAAAGRPRPATEGVGASRRMTDESGQLGPSLDGTVMLDIGGDRGALIIMAPPELHLAEIELSPVGDERAHEPIEAPAPPRRRARAYACPSAPHARCGPRTPRPVRRPVRRDLSLAGAGRIHGLGS